MADCLVNAYDNTTVKVRVINPFSEPVSIKQDTVVGQACRLRNAPVPLLEVEGDDVTNSSHIRSIVFENNRPNHDGTTSMDDSIKTVPEHLLELYYDAIENKSNREIKAIVKLLLEYQDVFSVNEHDLGL